MVHSHHRLKAERAMSGRTGTMPSEDVFSQLGKPKALVFFWRFNREALIGKAIKRAAKEYEVDRMNNLANVEK
jgi:hypothetical protein